LLSSCSPKMVDSIGTLLGKLLFFAMLGGLVYLVFKPRKKK
jgi:hypothetical protein